MEDNQNNNVNDVNTPNNAQKRLFSKEYFKYKFSKAYIKSGFANKWQKYLTFILIIAVVLALDLTLKSVFDQTKHDFIKGFISINGFAHNTGAGFSLFSSATTALAVLSIICLCLYFCYEYLTMENCRGFTFYTATALMVGGTIGNLADRLCLGYVRDFISLDFIDFPVFNIADCALTVGVIILAVWILFIESKEAKKCKK